MTEWRREPPDEPGDWLWVSMWDCDCCVRDSGIAWVIDEHDEQACDTTDLEKLPSGLFISWERSNPQIVNLVTGWLKLDLPEVIKKKLEV
jgi:hypothetical protein